jgi:PBP1b-binding outer membrane lipoprotein LpoB
MKKTVVGALLLLAISLTGCSNAELKAGQSQLETPQVKSFEEKEAVDMVLKDHPDFPNEGEAVNIETQTGGPYPGLKVDGELRTTVEKSTERDKYIVTLTKAWNTKVNDKEAKSVWTYEVTPDKVELISSEENADLVNTIK